MRLHYQNSGSEVACVRTALTSFICTTANNAALVRFLCRYRERSNSQICALLTAGHRGC
jgi:hypothetical protein